MSALIDFNEMKPGERPPASPPNDGQILRWHIGERPRASRSSDPMARLVHLTRCAALCEPLIGEPRARGTKLADRPPRKEAQFV
jgi:hypothetical protein